MTNSVMRGSRLMYPEEDTNPSRLNIDYANTLGKRFDPPAGAAIRDANGEDSFDHQVHEVIGQTEPFLDTRLRQVR